MEEILKKPVISPLVEKKCLFVESKERETNISVIWMYFGDCLQSC